MRTSSVLQGYLLFCLAYLAGLLFLPESIMFWAKCCLIPILLVAVWTSKPFAYQQLLLVALFFSWVGDVVIAFALRSEIYFILGLVSFLIAHVLYILIFLKSVKAHLQGRGYLTWAWGLLGIYLIAFLFVLFPHLGALKLPVIGYALVIGTMLASAIRGWSHWPQTPAQWVLIGAGSFVLSDSILAFNKFYAPLPVAAVLIMSTYLFAQYALVRGVIGLER